MINIQIKYFLVVIKQLNGSFFLKLECSNAALYIMTSIINHIPNQGIELFINQLIYLSFISLSRSDLDLLNWIIEHQKKYIFKIRTNIYFPLSSMLLFKIVNIIFFKEVFYMIQNESVIKVHVIFRIFENYYYVQYLSNVCMYKEQKNVQSYLYEQYSTV